MGRSVRRRCDGDADGGEFWRRVVKIEKPTQPTVVAAVAGEYGAQQGRC